MNELYEKYKAKNYQELPEINPLSFILRKAELGHNLTNSEWQWLEQHQQTETTFIIKSQEYYRYSISQKIREELMQLKQNRFVFNRINAVNINSEQTFILYKVHAQEVLTDSELAFVSPDYYQFLIFFSKKQKYSIKEDIAFDTTTQNIFDKLENHIQLSASDIEWLCKHNAYSFLTPLKTQFLKLQHKYNAVVSNEFRGNPLELFYILQKLDENSLPNKNETAFLTEHLFFDTLEIVQKIEFFNLKKKYKATQIEDDDIKHHLFKILKKLDTDSPLLEADINYLKKRKLFETVKFIYKKQADNLYEKINRGQNLTAENIAWCETHQYEEIIFEWLKTIYKVKHGKLDSPLYGILKKLHAGQRLTDDEVVWLIEQELLYSSRKLYIDHYTLEAKFYEQEFKRTKGYWHLVNASAAWRKAEKPLLALKQTNNSDFKNIKSAKLKAALLTTRGGALRDVDRLDEAEQCALDAIKYFPDSHNPYTLMGALCYDTGRYEEGDGWFEKAVKRGAKPQDQDAEIKRILLRKKAEERKVLAIHLWTKDRIRFNWVKEFL